MNTPLLVTFLALTATTAAAAIYGATVHRRHNRRPYLRWSRYTRNRAGYTEIGVQLTTRAGKPVSIRVLKTVNLADPDCDTQIARAEYHAGTFAELLNERRTEHTP